MSSYTYAADQYKINPYTNRLDNAGPIGLSGLSGNVGINSTSPSCQLDVGGTICSNGSPITGGAAVGIGTTNRIAKYIDSTNIGSPNNVVIDANGNIGIGSAKPLGTLEVWKDGAVGTIFNTAYGISGTSNTPQIVFRGARGTGAAPTALALNDRLGVFIGSSHNGTSFVNNASWDIYAAETQGGAASGSYMLWQTTNLGTTSRSEKMRLNSEGNLGIGTIAPIAKLDAEGTDTGTNILIASDAAVNITNTSTTTNNFADLSFAAKNTSNVNVVGAKISGVTTSHAGGDERADLVFLTRRTAALNERMRIISDGNVGIASSNPGTTLDVTGTVRATAFIGDGSGLTGVGITGADTGVVYLNGDNTPGVDVTNFYYDDAVKALHVGSVVTAATNTPQTDYFPIQSLDTHWIWGVNADGGNDNDDNITLSEGTLLGSSNRITVAPGGLVTIPNMAGTNFSSGNVGIGSSTPGTSLDIQGTMRSTGIQRSSVYCYNYARFI